MTLPAFKYHRDAIQSGSIVESAKKCRCCGKPRGFIYSGPAYSEGDLDDAICPWCIADGSANRKFGAVFVDEEGLASALPAQVVEELTERTPGYNAWQSERWLTCCNDAMTFLEPVGIRELRDRYRQLEFNVLGNIIYDLHISGGAAHRMLESLNRDGGPTAYVFQCLHCENYGTYVDGIFSI
jgi:uncharacterized protein CbrC (UPF0167 family)